MYIFFVITFLYQGFLIHSNYSKRSPLEPAALEARLFKVSRVNDNSTTLRALRTQPFHRLQHTQKLHLTINKNLRSGVFEYSILRDSTHFKQFSIDCSWRVCLEG